MIIYKAINLINNKIYIGKTIQSLNNRIKDHKFYKGNDYFHKAIRKYGIEKFKWEVLCECETPEILNIIETFMIIVHKSHVSESGYNLTWGGEGSNGFKHSEETKKKMREKRKLQIITEETRKKMSEAQKGRPPYRKGKKHTEESKKKMSKANKGENHPMWDKKHPKETIIKMSEAAKGSNNGFYGKHHSEETKKKISESHKGKKYNVTKNI